MEDKNWRKITITLDSAGSLPDVRAVGRMKVYARVWIRGYDGTAVETPTDNRGELNPEWNFAIKYTVPESLLYSPQMEFVVCLYCRRSFGSDGYVGHAIIPLKSLHDQGLNHAWTFPLLGTPNGTLKMFLANVSERVSAPEKKAKGSRVMSVLEELAGEALRTGVFIFLGVDIN